MFFFKYWISIWISISFGLYTFLNAFGVFVGNGQLGFEKFESLPDLSDQHSF